MGCQRQRDRLAESRDGRVRRDRPPDRDRAGAAGGRRPVRRRHLFADPGGARAAPERAEQHAGLHPFLQRRLQQQRYRGVRASGRLAARREHADPDHGLLEVRVRRTVRLRLHRRQRVRSVDARGLRPDQPGDPADVADGRQAGVHPGRVLRDLRPHVRRHHPGPGQQRAGAAAEREPGLQRHAAAGHRGHDDRQYRHATRVRSGREELLGLRAVQLEHVRRIPLDPRHALHEGGEGRLA